MNGMDYLKILHPRLARKTRHYNSNATDEEIKQELKLNGGFNSNCAEIARTLDVSHVRVRNVRKIVYGR